MKHVATRWALALLLTGFMLLHAGVMQASDLLAVYQQAAQADPHLDSAQEVLAAVQETKNQTRASLFLPEANLSGNLNYDNQNIRLRGSGGIGDSGRSVFAAGGYTLTLTQPILHYDRIIRWQQSDRRIAQAEAQFAAAKSDLLLRVAERYFDVLAAADNVRFAHAQQDALLRGLKEIHQRQAVGFLAMSDVQEAQAGYDRAVADAVEAEHLLRDAKESLQEVTGIYYEQLAGLQDAVPLIPPEPADEGRWVNQALEQNLGLLVSAEDVHIAQAAIDIQKAGHVPTLDAIGSRGFASTGGRFGSADVEDTIVGLSLNIPLYQGGQVNSRIREAQHRHREALAKLKQGERAVHRAASKAYLGVVAGVSRVKALQQTVLSGQTGLAATQAGFRAGRRTALDVIVAERERLRAQRDYARARYDYVLSTLRLKQAVGALSPEDLEHVNSWLTQGPDK